jgi:N-acetylneuraminate synthase
MRWKGPDIPISITPKGLRDLIVGSNAIWQASGGKKDILIEEQPTIDFAYACVVSILDIKSGDKFTKNNIWVKRPGTGEIKAIDYQNIIGKNSKSNIKKNMQIKWKDVN